MKCQRTAVSRKYGQVWAAVFFWLLWMLMCLVLSFHFSLFFFSPFSFLFPGYPQSVLASLRVHFGSCLQYLFIRLFNYFSPELSFSFRFVFCFSFYFFFFASVSVSLPLSFIFFLFYCLPGIV